MTRHDFIDIAEKKLLKKVKQLQKELLRHSSDFVFSNLSFDKKGVKDNLSNIRAIARLDKFIYQKMSKSISSLIKWIVKQFQKLARLNRKYFKDFGLKKSQFDNVNNKVMTSVGASMTGSGVKLLPGGYLSGLIDLTEPIKAIKRIVRMAVVGSLITAPTLKKNITKTVEGGEKLGLVEKRFYSEANNTFTLIDRTYGQNLAKSTGLRAAVYQGGTITTTRPFCKERNNKVFTFDEIRSWADLSFQGKPDNYNPFTDCGGFNCRHTLDYISDELAIILRPELKDIWGIAA